MIIVPGLVYKNKREFLFVSWLFSILDWFWMNIYEFVFYSLFFAERWIHSRILEYVLLGMITKTIGYQRSQILLLLCSIWEQEWNLFDFWRKARNDRMLQWMGMWWMQVDQLYSKRRPIYDETIWSLYIFYFWFQNCWQIVLSFSLVLHKVSDGRWIKWDTAVVQVISQMQQVWRMLLIDHCVHIEFKNSRMDSYCISICIQTQKWVIYQPSTNGWLNCWILCCFVQTNTYTKRQTSKETDQLPEPFETTRSSRECIMQQHLTQKLTCIVEYELPRN